MMCGERPEGREEAAPQERARRYTAIHHRLFLARILLLVVLLVLFHTTGASMRLADGLRVRFDSAWGWVNLVYLAVTFFGYGVLFFPLSLYEEYVVENRFGQSNQDFAGWMKDAMKSFGLELVLSCFFFSALYAFLAWVPATWWIWATAFYISFAILLSAIAPVLILPWFYEVETLEDPDLVQDITELLHRVGLQVIGVFRWGLGAKTKSVNAALAGIGGTRRIILSDTLLDQYQRDEILAVLAHEVGHYRHRDIPRMLLLSTVVSGAAFYLAHLGLLRGTAGSGFAGVADISAFPVLILCLLAVALVALPLINGYSRRREFAADAYAVSTMEDARPLVSALEKMADQNLAEKEPARWIEFLLYSHPSIARRVAHARKVDVSL